MKAVILAAGEGTRMRPLTEDTPKPLLPVAGQPVIQHTVDLVQDTVDEIIVVAGYQKEKIGDYFSNNSDVTIVEQENAEGTAHAALQAREHIDGKTLVINGDDIYQVDTEKISSVDRGIVADRAENPENYGVLTVENGKVTGIEEKPENPDTDLVNTGFYIVQEDFFELLEDVEKSERGEYEITDAVTRYAEDSELELLEAEDWLSCGYPWNLIDANSGLLEEQERDISGEVDESASIKGNVVIEDGAEIKEHTVIEGPALIKSGAEIGPFTYIRPGTVVHSGAVIRNSEIKNSVIREDTHIPHFNYVGDSYIGREVNLGGGAKVANVLNNGETVKMQVNGELIDTGNEKLGTVIAHGAKIGLGTLVKPGRKIGSGALTDAGEKVEKNIPSGAVLKDGEIIENRD